MAAPYEVGQAIASLTEVPEGMRVCRDQVQEITQLEEGRFLVTTKLGQYVVDGQGDGDCIVIDSELEAVFAERGDDFVVEPSEGHR